MNYPVSITNKIQFHKGRGISNGRDDVRDDEFIKEYEDAALIYDARRDGGARRFCIPVIKGGMTAQLRSLKMLHLLIMEEIMIPSGNLKMQH